MKKYNLVTDTISKKNYLNFPNGLDRQKNLQWVIYVLNLRKNFLHLFKENIRFLLIVALLQIY